jgi:hypothetical protein
VVDRWQDAHFTPFEEALFGKVDAIFGHQAIGGQFTPAIEISPSADSITSSWREMSVVFLACGSLISGRSPAQLVMTSLGSNHAAGK